MQVAIYDFETMTSPPPWVTGVPPLFALIIREFNCTQTEASQLSTYALLALGLSNIFAAPATSLIGKRYTILLSLVLFLVTNAWAAVATSYTSLRTARLLGGLAGGLIEALGPTIVAEVFPPHQLARAMVVYVGLLAAGSALGPIVAGAVAQTLGDWRWYQRIIAIAVAVNLVSCILMLPETTHDARMNWSKALVRTIQPVQLIAAPQVIVTVLVFGLTVGWSATISILVATVYAQPPMIWNSLHVGLMSAAPLIGLIIGLPIGGMLADFLSNRAAKSHSHDPATRLPAVLLGALISPAGCLAVGYGLRDPQAWIKVSAGWAMLSLGLTGSANILLTHAVDCLPSRAGDVGALVNLIKNFLAFGVSYASIDWMQRMGPVRQFAIMAGLLWFAYLLILPVWLLRKTMLQMTTKFNRA
ncbi:major facilitator superfamily domain-containing protein [Aspergillus californicus]